MISSIKSIKSLKDLLDIEQVIVLYICTDTYACLLTPWSRVLLEKLTSKLCS